MNDYDPINESKLGEDFSMQRAPKTALKFGLKFYGKMISLFFRCFQILI
jgi:hypothetical protein